MKQLAQNEGRWYRVEKRQSRYFPISTIKALALLATGDAFEVAYLPFSRPDLLRAYMEAQQAITAAQAA